MLYRFHENGDGSVDSESKEPFPEPYLHLHYPAADIPRQARELYLKDWLRIIPDSRYVPVPIVPTLRPDTGAPLDLSFSVLRSVSPIHLEYMANMAGNWSATPVAMSIFLDPTTRCPTRTSNAPSDSFLASETSALARDMLG